jgi:ParB family chromosome partitioning protein
MMSVKSRGLGKGLDLLLKGSAPEDSPQGIEVCDIPLVDIFPNPSQPRQTFTEEGLEDLARSIQTQGILQPILVRPRPGKSLGYEIVAGERRWRASQRTDLKSIPALVRNIDDKETLAIALIENLQREDLNPIEEAQGLLRVKDELELSQEELSKRVGRSRSAVANSIRLLQLPDEIQEDIKAKKISSGHARAYLALGDNDAKMKAHAQVLGRQLNVRQTEVLIRQMLADVQSVPSGDKTDNDVLDFRKQCKAELERVLGRSKGLSLRVSGGPAKGAITFSYASSEERERVLQILQHGADRSVVEE